MSGRPRAALPFRLLLVTDPALRPDVVAACQEALGGARPGQLALLLRAPGATEAERRRWAEALLEPARRAGALLLAHGAPAWLAEVPVDGAHLPSAEPRAAEAVRVEAGRELLLGRSCHDAAELGRAAGEGADYATLSPLFEVPGKGPALGPERFGRLAAGAALPVVALGGLGLAPGRLEAALEAGAAAVALRRAVFAAPDPARAVAEALQALDRAARAAS